MHTNKGKGRGPCGFNLALPSPAHVAKTHRKAISLLILAKARPRARARLAQSVLGQVVENPTHARLSHTMMLGGGLGKMPKAIGRGPGEPRVLGCTQGGTCAMRCCRPRPQTVLTRNPTERAQLSSKSQNGGEDGKCAH